MSEQCVGPTVKNGVSSVIVWDCFDGTAVGDLRKIEGIPSLEATWKYYRKMLCQVGKDDVAKTSFLKKLTTPNIHLVYKELI